MAVLAIKTEPKCKLCKHPNRPDIDALLERRSKGDSDAHGNRINEQYVLKQLHEWGVENPTKQNLTNHFAKHCELVTDEEAVEREQELSELQAEMLEALEESDGTIDGDLEAIRKVGMRAIRRKILEGRDPGITNDHVLKAVAEQTKRSSNEAARTLLGTLTAGLAGALAKPKEPKQIEGAEVITVEAVEE